MRIDRTTDGREAAIRRSSRTLSDLLDREPAARAALAAAGDDSDHWLGVLRSAFDEGGPAGLTRAKRLRLLGIAGRDLTSESSLEETCAALSDLADSCLRVALEASDPPSGLALVAMGKLGARELNYYSDIDVMFVTDGDLEEANASASAVIRFLTEFTPQGRCYAFDANLRPEGRSGALVRTLDGYMEYYERWAKDWEFQALIKARSAAGNVDVGHALVDRTRALVFSPEISAQRIHAIRTIKETVERQTRATARNRPSSGPSDVKLGWGGIRDIEFALQLLQLVHGGTDETVRSPATLDALSALVAGGYLAEDDGAGLSVAYRWLRSVEHRLQLWQERKVVQLPADGDRRRVLARSMGYVDTPMASAWARFEEAHASVLRDVRSRFEKLFYRPMIESLSGAGGTRMTPDALAQRMRVLGFRDIDRATRTLEGLVSGTSRRASLLRLLTPVFLRHVASAPLPDQGLYSFLRLGEMIEDRLEALGALRDNPPALQLLARVLGGGRIPGELLLGAPDELHAIADPRVPVSKGRARLAHEAKATLEWREPERRLDGLRRFKRRELLRIILGDIRDGLQPSAVGAELGDLADACVAAALGSIEFPFAVIGLGKLGGRELTYPSDLDVMFVHEGHQAAAENAAERLMSALSETTSEGRVFAVDAGLRPEGKSGTLARSLESFAVYYDRWAQHWEHQALLKARFVAGDEDLAARLLARTRSVVLGATASPARLAEIRHLKARMEKERIPRGVDPRRHLKLGPGGITDVEFSCQVLQLQHAHAHPQLRAQSTLPALAGAHDVGLIDDADHRRLVESYVWLTRLRNRLYLMTGRSAEVVPSKPEDLEALGISLGFRDQPRQQLEEMYLRITRRARKVAQAIIYGNG
jgi:[glutamine synthetase] adenylyltransferase / [glutamine synthetase]-adenylyl-L-tyrosine phosphorylase